jgi:hypothetical protein
MSTVPTEVYGGGKLVPFQSGAIDALEDDVDPRQPKIVGDGEADHDDQAFGTEGCDLVEKDNYDDTTVDSDSSEDDPAQIDLSGHPANDASISEEDKQKQEKVLAISMELNEAFMALENMRKANLEVEFGGKAIPNISLFHQYCRTCLYSQKQRQDAYLSKHGDLTARRAFLKNAMNRLKSRQRHPLCLVCTSPVCSKHCCKDFSKEKITVCGSCAPLFTMDFVVEAFSNREEARRQECMMHVIDSYDRALLMLKYSSQFIDEIADALETNARKTDHVGLGSSMFGLTSGFTGVAAVAAHLSVAAAILSPAGPPLLVASILFGASAAAASTGTEAINYYSEPNRLANKIIALYDLVHSLLGVTMVLKDSMALGHVDPRHYIDMHSGKRTVAYWKSRAPPPTMPLQNPTPDSKEVGLDSGLAKAPSEENSEAETLSENKQRETILDGGDEGDPDERVQGAHTDTDAPSNTFEEAIKNEGSGLINAGAPEKIQEARASGKLITENSPAIDLSTADTEVITTVEHHDVCSVLAPKDSAQLSSTTNKSEGCVPESTESQIVRVAPSNLRCAVSRTTTNAMKLCQFASIACVMLSFTTIVLETKNMRDTLRNLRAGSPCEKALRLRDIKKKIESLPGTQEVAAGCESYLKKSKAN